MGEAGARPSLLLYCQHVLGMGHLVRSLALAESLAARFHVVFLNGGPVPHGVPRPRCIDFIDLPPVGFDPAGRLVSRDGRRIYFTNALYTPWDEQFYPDGVRSWMVKLNAAPQGGMEIDPDFFVDFHDRPGGPARAHEVRLQNGDCTTEIFQ